MNNPAWCGVQQADSQRWLWRAAVALLISTAGATACSSDEKAEETAPSGPEVREVGVLELPISLRSSDAEPADARKVELNLTGIRVEGQGVLALSNGTVPDAERKGDTIAALAKALAPAKSTLALSVHASLPYETLALALNTAKSAGFRALSFRVRKVGTATDTGWLSVPSFALTPRVRSGTQVEIASVQPLDWDDFTAKWEDIYNACRTSQTGNCAYVPSNVEKGGQLKLVLLAAGQGSNVHFFRAGGDSAQQSEAEQARKAELAKKKEDFIQGRITKKDIEKELLEGPPATEALFQFRAREAVVSPSPLSATLAPLCGKKACGAVVSGEPNTLSARVLSLIGAAFPDGTPAPHLAFELPWTEAPKLSKDEIMEQAAQDALDSKVQQAAGDDLENE